MVLNTFLGQVLIGRGAIGWRFLLDVFLAAVFALVAWQAIPYLQARGLGLANLFAYSAAAVALLVPVTYYWRNPDSKRAQNALTERVRVARPESSKGVVGNDITPFEDSGRATQGDSHPQPAVNTL